MNVFSSLFGSKENQKNSSATMAWIPLVDLGQLNEIVLASEAQPVIIFKHSTTCGISRMALKQFENEFDLQDKVSPYFLDLLQHRDISNAIAERFVVQHQSPQLLLIRDGKSIFDASHSAISVAELHRNLVVR